MVDPHRHEVSSRYRSQCRPGTGTASGKCQAGTGATPSSMNRNFTPASGLLAHVDFAGMARRRRQEAEQHGL